MAVPRKHDRNTGFSIARFIDCMAVMYTISVTRASPMVTEHDHAKKSPAMSAVVVAVITRRILESVIIGIMDMDLSLE
jgi:hypothetical protein